MLAMRNWSNPRHDTGAALYAASWRKANGGATAIEFALVAPILFLMIIGIVELSLIMISMSIMEGATSIAARTGKTGYDTGNTRADFENYVRDEVSLLSAGLLNPANLNIKVTSFDNFDDMTYANHTDSAEMEDCASGYSPPCPQPGHFIDANCDGVWDQKGANGAGGAGQTVLYTVTYPWILFTPMMANIFNNGSYLFQINAIAAVKNEPFPNGTPNNNCATP